MPSAGEEEVVAEREGELKALGEAVTGKSVPAFVRPGIFRRSVGADSSPDLRENPSERSRRFGGISCWLCGDGGGNYRQFCSYTPGSVLTICTFAVRLHPKTPAHEECAFYKPLKSLTEKSRGD